MKESLPAPQALVWGQPESAWALKLGSAPPAGVLEEPLAQTVDLVASDAGRGASGDKQVWQAHIPCNPTQSHLLASADKPVFWRRCRHLWLYVMICWT